MEGDWKGKGKGGLDPCRLVRALTISCNFVSVLQRGKSGCTELLKKLESHRPSSSFCPPPRTGGPPPAACRCAGPARGVRLYLRAHLPRSQPPPVPALRSRSCRRLAGLHVVPPPGLPPGHGCRGPAVGLLGSHHAGGAR